MRHAIVHETNAPEAGRGERRPDAHLPHSQDPTVEARHCVSRDRDRAVVSRGDRHAFSVSLAGYRGVAVRIEPIGPERSSVILELNHEDERRCVVLLTAEDPGEIVADWQAFSHTLSLPMLLIEADGTVSQPIHQLGQVLLNAPKPRRRYSYFAARRPRFLVRRKTGWARGVETLRAEEIIARD